MKFSVDNFSMQDDDDIWFEIHKDPSCVDPSHCKNENDKLSQSSESLDSIEVKSGRNTSDQLTYQEIMVFIKLINVFEDKRYQNQMILWLLIQFPMASTSLLNYLASIPPIPEGAEMNNQQYNVPEIIDSDSDYDIVVADPEFSEKLQHLDVLEYLFPLKIFHLILDNMSNHQIIDLYTKISGDSCQSLS